MIKRAGFRRALLSAATVVLLVGSVATAAPATSAEGPAPKAGFVDAPDAVPVGWTGPLTVGWLNSSDPQTYTVEVTGAGGYRFTEDLFIDEGTSVREPVEIAPVEQAGDYVARFLDAEGTEVVPVHEFHAAVPVGLEVGPSSPSTFLPRVRDGIKDATTLPFTVDREARVVGEVVDQRGRVVHRVGLGLRQPGSTHRWTWYGRAPGGTVDRGTYQLRVVATADGLDTARAVQARVASYKVPVKRTVRRLGTQTTTRSPGECRVLPAGAGALHVDCRGASRGAVLAWRFTPGRSASGLRWLVERDGPASLKRRESRGAVTITARVRPGQSLTTRRVLVSYASQQQR